MLVQKKLKNAYIGEYRVPGANTVAYYPMKGDLNDYSGNNHNFTVNSGYSYSYDSGTNLTTINSSSGNTNNGIYADLLFPNGSIYDRTISVWANSSVTGVFSFRTNAGGTGGFLRPSDPENGNRPGVSLYLSGWYRNRPSSVSVGSTFLMTWTKTGNTMKLYLNGDLVSTTTLGTSSWTGTYENMAFAFGTSKMSELIIENKERTAQEISDYYNQTKGNYGL